MGKNILGLSAAKAKDFFLTQAAFLNIELPPYFSFSKVLSDVSNAIDKNFKEKTLLKSEIEKAKKQETVNHILYGNKDGKYTWRKFQIINPLIYISLVNIITNKDNWKFLQSRFKKFQNNDSIRCESLPIVPTGKRKQTGDQILQWINNIEKKSIELSLEYNFLYHTDISNCYGSIYTHSIPWAIHSKKKAKSKRKFKDLFSNRIDHHLQAMSNGQTNGIPEGSILMDFIAEIILGYADLELTKKLKKIFAGKKAGKKYHILRYRDDYRIFVNDTNHGEVILKCLSEVLLELGFRLNANKTRFNQDIITGSLKEDKAYLLKYELVPKKLSKYELLRQLLLVQQIGKKFSNAGVLKNRLSKIFDRAKSGDYGSQEKTLISILIDIGYNNPHCFSLVAGLISSCIRNLPKSEQKKLLIMIKKKIGMLPNIGLLEVWIQRIVIGLKLKLNFNEKLCKFTYDAKNKNVHILENIFISDWIGNQEIKNILNDYIYVKESIIRNLKTKIDSKEIQPFTYEN